MMMVFVSTFFLLLPIMQFDGFVMVKSETEEAGFIVNMSVTYHNNGTEGWVLTNEDCTIGLFMNNTWQTVQLVNHSFPLENTTFDEDGNSIAVLQFPESQVNLGENISYTVTYQALSKPREFPDIKEENSSNLDDIPEVLTKNYCGEGDTWMVNDPELQGLARSIVENETRVLTIVKNFVEWIRKKIDYPVQAHEVPLYPNETYARLEGDCDDQAILFITLCRIYKIPAYLQIGCIYDPKSFDDSKYWSNHLRSILRKVGWHGWAMAYVPPWGWLPVDLTYVLGGYVSPLDAIKKAAVTSRSTLQYMNVNQTDYVASSRRYRDFLENNDFYVYTEDEIIEVSPTNHGNDAIGKLFPWLPIVAAVVVAVTAAGIFVYVWKRERPKEIESNPSLSF
jgi:transglutaminase-like putative cysteine protease